MTFEIGNYVWSRFDCASDCFKQCRSFLILHTGILHTCDRGVQQKCWKFFRLNGIFHIVACVIYYKITNQGGILPFQNDSVWYICRYQGYQEYCFLANLSNIVQVADYHRLVHCHKSVEILGNVKEWFMFLRKLDNVLGLKTLWLN